MFFEEQNMPEDVQLRVYGDTRITVMEKASEKKVRMRVMIMMMMTMTLIMIRMMVLKVWMTMMIMIACGVW
jgi:uncharacterized membrane protein YqjE